MTIDDRIGDEKLQDDFNREAVKISALLSRNIHKYEDLTGEEMLPSNQKQIIEQAKFAYSPLGKAFEKQTEKYIDAMKPLDSSYKLKQIHAKLKKIVKLQDIIKKDYLNLKSKRGKNFGKSSLPIVFLRDRHRGYLLLEDTDNKLFAIELKNFDKGIKKSKKSSLYN